MLADRYNNKLHYYIREQNKTNKIQSKFILYIITRPPLTFETEIDEGAA